MSDTVKTTNVKSFRILMLILGALTMFVTGVLYAWSILKAPFKFEASELALNYTICLCSFGFGGLFSGIFAKKIPLRIRLIIGTALVGLGFSLATFVTDNVLLLYLAYGLLSGFGIGIVYNAVIGSVNSWFPDKKGFSAGVLMMSFGISTLIIGNVASKLFNLEGFGWKNTYYLLAALIVIVTLIFTAIAKMPSANDALPAASKKTSTGASEDYPASSMIKRATFWKLFIFFMLFTAVGSTIIGFAKDFTLTLGAKESLAVTIVGIVSVCNGLGRLLAGEIFDRLGLKVAQFTTSAIVILATAISLIGILTSSLVIGIIGMCLCGISYGFSPTISAAFIASFYGMKHYPTNLSIINLVLIPASFMSTIAGSIGDYSIIFTVLLSISLIGLIINLTIKKP
ncbi:MAG: MFS transporter [Clostridia bacterium]|nr:MFS transporter [Clostridia bacterium]